LSLTIITAWLAANYALAAFLTHRAARRGGAAPHEARAAGLRWPLALAASIARDQTGTLRRA